MQRRRTSENGWGLFLPGLSLRWLLWCATALGPSLATKRVRAEPARRVWVHVEPSDPCFRPERFLHGVESRLDGVSVGFVPTNSHIEVRVVANRGEYVARVRLLKANGNIETRQISSASCAEVTDGIAFVVSVALDEEPTRPSPSSIETTEPHAARQSRTRTSSTAVLSAGAVVDVGSLPRPAVGASGLGLWLAKAPGWWSPALGVAVRGFPAVRVERPQGTGTFGLVQAMLSACPSQLRWRFMHLHPCGAASVGQLRARGTATESGRLSRRPFVNVGGQLIVGVDAGRYVAIFITGSLEAPLIVDRFQFDEDIFFQPRALTYSMGAQLGIRLF